MTLYQVITMKITTRETITTDDINYYNREVIFHELIKASKPNDIDEIFQGGVIPEKLSRIKSDGYKFVNDRFENNEHIYKFIIDADYKGDNIYYNTHFIQLIAQIKSDNRNNAINNILDGMD